MHEKYLLLTITILYLSHIIFTYKYCVKYPCGALGRHIFASILLNIHIIFTGKEVINLLSLCNSDIFFLRIRTQDLRPQNTDACATKSQRQYLCIRNTILLFKISLLLYQCIPQLVCKLNIKYFYFNKAKLSLWTKCNLKTLPLSSFSHVLRRYVGTNLYITAWELSMASGNHN